MSNLDTLDPRAKQFLADGDGPVREVKGGTVAKAEQKHAEFVQKEFLLNSEKLNNALLAFWNQERKRLGLNDDEAIAGVALFTMNLRHAYGSPQNPAEQKVWNEQARENKLRHFDTICSELQVYFDENKDKDD